MEKYVIFTKQQGRVFYICHNDEKGFYVSGSALDDQVLKTDYETAKNIAEENTVLDVLYEIKKI